MDYRNLGRSGLKVSSLCLGTMTFGEADENSMMHRVCCDEPTAHAILGRALDAGINFVDTADIYGQDGLSERVLGNWFQATGRRDEVILATKYRFRMHPGPNGIGASRYRLRQCIEASLRRLKTDRVELLQVHMQDVETPSDEILRSMDDLVRAGKVLYIGCSNYAAYRLVESLWISRTQHLERFVSAQMLYNLVNRELEREHLPLCEQYGVGILPWSPLAGGFLTGKYRKDADPPAGTRLDHWRDRLTHFDKPRNWKILDALTAVATELGTTPAAVALAWLLGRPCVASVVFGARDVEQLEQNLAAAALVLPESAVNALDEASKFEIGYPYTFIARTQGRW